MTGAMYPFVYASKTASNLWGENDLDAMSFAQNISRSRNEALTLFTPAGMQLGRTEFRHGEWRLKAADDLRVVPSPHLAELMEAVRVVNECPATGDSGKREGAMARLRVAYDLAKGFGL